MMYELLFCAAVVAWVAYLFHVQNVVGLAAAFVERRFGAKAFNVASQLLCVSAVALGLLYDYSVMPEVAK